MTEEPQEYDAPPAPAEQRAATGYAAVDEVLASLEGLEDSPLSEHVAAFESAHERLRGLLTDAGDEQPRS